MVSMEMVMWTRLTPWYTLHAVVVTWNHIVFGAVSLNIHVCQHITNIKSTLPVRLDCVKGDGTFGSECWSVVTVTRNDVEPWEIVCFLQTDVGFKHRFRSMCEPVVTEMHRFMVRSLNLHCGFECHCTFGLLRISFNCLFPVWNDFTAHILTS